MLRDKFVQESSDHRMNLQHLRQLENARKEFERKLGK